MSRSDRNKRVTRSLLARWPLPHPREGDKDDRGTILIVAGSQQMPGAVLLAGVAALRAGAGKLQIATSETIAAHVATALPEALVTTFEHAAQHAERADAAVFGPGMNAHDAAQLYDGVARAARCPLLVDAGAFEAFARSDRRTSATVITPHAKEAASLLQRDADEITRDARGALLELVTRFGATAALKGRVTLISGPQERVYENVRGHWGLATSGSGDTLAGIIGGLLARGLEPLAASAWGVYVHALAGERLARRIGTGFLSREIPGEIPGIMKRLQP